MNDGYNASLAILGSSGTVVLTDLNPYLAFMCGVLTLVHVTWSILIMWQKRNKKRK